MALSNYGIVFRTLYLLNNDKKSIDLELQEMRYHPIFFAAPNDDRNRPNIVRSTGVIRHISQTYCCYIISCIQRSLTSRNNFKKLNDVNTWTILPRRSSHLQFRSQISVIRFLHRGKALISQYFMSQFIASQGRGTNIEEQAITRLMSRRCRVLRKNLFRIVRQ